YEAGDPWWAPPPERPFAETTAQSPARLRVAVTSAPPIDVPVDPECVAAVEEAAALLSELGHHVQEGSPAWHDPNLFDTFIEVWQTGPTLHPVDEALLTPLHRRLAESARASSAADYVRAVARLQMLARRIVAFWS